LLVLLLLVSISSAVALSRGGSETNKPDSTVACREDTSNYGDACAVESDRTDPK